MKLVWKMARLSLKSKGEFKKMKVKKVKKSKKVAKKAKKMKREED